MEIFYGCRYVLLLSTDRVGRARPIWMDRGFGKGIAGMEALRNVPSWVSPWLMAAGLRCYGAFQMEMEKPTTQR